MGILRLAGGEITRTFCFITSEASALMAPIHNSEPVVLHEPDWPLWLGEAEGDPGALLHPAEPGVLEAWPVKSRVNTPREDDAGLLDRLTPTVAAGRVHLTLEVPLDLEPMQVEPIDAALCGCSASPFLHQDVQHHAVLIDRTPETMERAVDR